MGLLEHCTDRIACARRTSARATWMVESFEIEVPFVRTDDNIGDFFTKAFVKNAKKFVAHRRVIMNEG